VVNQQNLSHTGLEIGIATFQAVGDPLEMQRLRRQGPLHSGLGLGGSRQRRGSSRYCLLADMLRYGIPGPNLSRVAQVLGFGADRMNQQALALSVNVGVLGRW
jgi:hypothetical protein